MPKMLLSALDKYHDLMHHAQTEYEAGVVRTVGQRLIALRRRHNFSRGELARRVRVDAELILIVENGDGDAVTALELLRLAIDATQASQNSA